MAPVPIWNRLSTPHTLDHGNWGTYRSTWRINHELTQAIPNCSVQTSIATWSTLPRSALESLWKSKRARGTHMDAIWLLTSWWIFGWILPSKDNVIVTERVSVNVGTSDGKCYGADCYANSDAIVCVRDLPRVNLVGTVCWYFTALIKQVLRNECLAFSVLLSLTDLASRSTTATHQKSFKQRAFLLVWRCFDFDCWMPG